MTESDIRIIEGTDKKITKVQKILLDSGFELVYLYSLKDEKLSDLFQNKILDTFLDKVGTKNPYKDFSRGLEVLNSFLQNWDIKKDIDLDALVGLYDGRAFHFSTIGSASVLLGNARANVVEVSDKDDSPKTFHFISSGDVGAGETLILSNIRLLDILSKDDIEDGLGTKYIRSSGENIEHILHIEKTEESIACISMRISHSEQSSKESLILQNISYHFFKIFDNAVIKKILGYLYHIRDSILQKQKHTVQIIFGLGMILSVVVIYVFISSVFSVVSKTQDVNSLQDTFLEAQDFYDRATQAITNADLFDLYYTEVDTRLIQLESSNMFTDDVKSLRDNLMHLESQVNFTQSFQPTGELVYHTFPEEKDVVQLIRTDSGRLYAIHERSITGPIIRGETADNYVYNALGAQDRFIDATNVGNDIMIQTESGKVISFGTNNRFSIVNVTGQDTWFQSPLIQSFNQNLYTISPERDQLYRHLKSGANYREGTPYLEDDDKVAIGGMRAIGIDGGIYILKDDGMFLKFFSNPYRIESLTLNRLPRNYISLVTDLENKVDMSASTSYNHVYVLIGSRLFVFEPNTRRATDTKSLRFMGQIESQTSDLQAFHVVRDGDVFFADNRGIYRLRFDIEDFGVVIR